MSDILQSILKKYQLFILPAVAALISLGLLGLLIIPEALKVPKTGQQIQSVKDQAQVLKIKQGTLDGLNVSDYQDYVLTALKAIPSDKDITNALDNVLYLLRTNNLLLNDLSFALGGKTTTEVTSYGIKINVSGSEQDIKNFITNTKNIPRILKVETLDLEQGNNTKGTTISTSIKIYYQNLPTVIGSVDAPVNLPSKTDLDVLNNIKTQLQTIQSPVSSSPSGVIGKADPFQ